MKKIWILLLITVFFSGCGTGRTYETLGSVPQTKPPVQPKNVSVILPEGAAETVWKTDEGTFYDCDGYTVSLQTLNSGDFAQTVKTLSGFRPDKLTILESGDDGQKRYDWVWTAAGADEQMLCRAAVIDDGDYHYCLCVMAEADTAGNYTQLWNELFSSFRLEL